jgi:hypothetical protein
MLTKRSFITAATALAFSATLMTTVGLRPAFAIGGDDPINGIDIIIKKNPGSQPIKPFSLTEREIKQLNVLKGADRPMFVLKTVAVRIDAGENFVKSGMNALGTIWCGPCKMRDEIEVQFTDAKVTYTLGLTFQSGDSARPTKSIPSKPVKGN